MRTWKYALTVFLFLFCLTKVANANLAAVGPTDPINGFPMWYQDLAVNGERLQLCLDGDGVNGPCLFDPPIADPLDPAYAFSQQTGFGAEAFYWMGEASVDVGPIKALLVTGLEATYGTGIPVNGDQIIFARVRVRVSGLPMEGIYTVVHPFGVFQFNVVQDPAAPAKRDINYTEDVGIGTFSGALRGRIGPFLRWSGADVTDPTRPYVDPITNFVYLGNPQVPHTVTGSPFNMNYFMIIGPPEAVLDPARPVGEQNVLFTDLFTLVGKVATRFGVTAERSAYQRGGIAGDFVDVFASSIPGQLIQVAGIGAAPSGMLEQPDAGRYYARIPLNGAAPPAVITVSNVLDNPPTVVESKVTDTVTAQPTYDDVTGVLTITAQSSDLTVPQTFTAGEFPLVSLPGMQAPPAYVTVTSSPGGGSDTEPVGVVAGNQAPQILSAPITGAIVGQLYSYQVIATDYLFDTLTYSLDPTVPTGMTISATGLITWTPPTAAVLPYTVSVTLQVQDQGGLSATQTYTITVAENLPPQITSLPVLTANIGQPYTYQVVAQDPNGGPITYSLEGVPPTGMTISLTGLVSWTPAAAGVFPVTVRVDDAGGLFATQPFDITVTVPNTPPVITPAPLMTIPILQPFSYQVQATDSPGDVLTYQLTAAPAGMTIDAATGLVSWTPPTAGPFSFTVMVTDQGNLSASQTFQVEVANAAPVITSLPVTIGVFNQPYTYQVVATDATPGEVLTYSLDTAPAGMTIDAAGGLISWTPNITGLFDVTVRVTDRGGLFVLQSFQLTIANVQPAITSQPVTTAIVGQIYNYQVVATDPGDTLTYSLTTREPGITISATGLITWVPPRPGVYNVTVIVTDSGALSATQRYQITVTNQANQILRLIRASYSARTRTWQINGFSNTPRDTVTLHYGSATGPVITSVTVPFRGGSWRFRGRTAFNPTNPGTVTAVSSTTNTSVSIPIQFLR